MKISWFFLIFVVKTNIFNKLGFFKYLLMIKAILNVKYFFYFKMKLRSFQLLFFAFFFFIKEGNCLMLTQVHKNDAFFYKFSKG